MSVKKKSWHVLSVEESLQELAVDKEKGLSEEEVSERRKKSGSNRLEEVSKKPWWLILVSQFNNTTIYLLSACCLIAFLSLRVPEGFTILAVIAVNIAIGFFSEYRAVRSMASLLRQETLDVKVRRNGKKQKVSDADLVPGDIVLVEEGLIAADMRVLKVDHLRINEASLTGEFVPVDKNEEKIEEERSLTERSNMLYKGTTIVEGSGVAVVVETGNQTELGRVSKLAERSENTVAPLQVRLNSLAKTLAWITVAITLCIAAIGLLIRSHEARQIIETALALGVAAIPEGLPIVATIALAHGMYLMAMRNAIVNNLMAVETLGSTDVIFTDKTGTLTENQMRLAKVLTGEGTETLENKLSENALKAIKIGVYCNTADPEEEAGDPTEIALLEAGENAGFGRKELIDKRPQIRIERFDPKIKMMATVHKHNGSFFFAVKGAPEKVLDVSDSIEGKEIGSDKKEEWSKKADKLAAEGLRVLAVASKSGNDKDEDPYTKLNLVGFVCLEDPAREGIKEAINTFQKAGIRVEMVTGDQPETAKAIAKKVGIVGGTDDPEIKLMTGKDLNEGKKLSEKKIEEIFETNIFARVSPHDKLSLVKIYQERGKVVAITGDGVNDAPALKKADIGISMGIRGTKTAKQMADIVLKDDAFETIVVAINQGRVIFGNIRKSIMFMLCTNIAEVITIASATFLGWVLPLKPLQILYLNVLTDVLPALALAVGPASGHEMNEPPRSSKEGLLTKSLWMEITGWAILIALCSLSSLQLAIHWLLLPEKAAVTVSFLTLAFAKLWFPFNLRGPRTHVFFNEITRNSWLWGAVALCIPLLVITVYLPGLNSLLLTDSPGINGWTLLLVLSLIPLFLGQLGKKLKS